MTLPKYTWQVVGFVGLAAALLLYALNPSFPTPDKLLIVLLFAFMAFRMGKQLFIRLAPFVGLMLVYEFFRGLIPMLNQRVAYEWMPAVDIWMFGGLPTAILQDWWWTGTVQWYDSALYLPYLLHFVLPLVLALLIWRYHEKLYWQYVTSFVILCFAAFFTFLAMPAAPPWLASDKGYIEPITRVSSNVWASLGVQDFPSLYNKIAANPVAAVPSLHAGFATLFAIYVFVVFGKKWGALATIYPIIIYVGTIYTGEHYFIDELLGSIYAIIVFFAVKWFFSKGYSSVVKDKFGVLPKPKNKIKKHSPGKAVHNKARS